MKLIRNILITFLALYVLELTTLRMWSHPAFILLLAGVISLIYRQLFSKPIPRRYVRP